jgi:hypothetical protein
MRRRCMHMIKLIRQTNTKYVPPISLEMMYPQRRECAVVCIMAIDRRLPQEAEVQRKRMEDRGRYRTRGVDQRCVMLSDAGEIRCLGCRAENVRQQRLDHACDGRAMGEACDHTGQVIGEMANRIRQFVRPWRSGPQSRAISSLEVYRSVP